MPSPSRVSVGVSARGWCGEGENEGECCCQDEEGKDCREGDEDWEIHGCSLVKGWSRRSGVEWSR